LAPATGGGNGGAGIGNGLHGTGGTISINYLSGTSHGSATAIRDEGKATIPEDCYPDAYDTLQTQEIILKENPPRHGEDGEVYHFVKNTQKGKIINAILEKAVDEISLRVETIDLEEKDRLLGDRDLKKSGRKITDGRKLTPLSGNYTDRPCAGKSQEIWLK